MPLQFLPDRDPAPYAMGIYPKDSYPEEKTHNHAKYIYAPYLFVPLPAEIVKYCSGGCVSRRFVAAGVDCGLVRAQMQITGDANWTSRR